MQIDWAVVFATIAGPILAVWAADIRAARKTQRDRQEAVYRTLVSTRGNKLRWDHVEAINNIEFSFPPSAHVQIEEARKLYRLHLQSPGSADPDQAIRNAWYSKAEGLFADLLQHMAGSLKIPFQRSEIVQSSYRPDAHALQEFELNEIRGLLLAVLKNGRPVNIRLVPDAPQPQAPSRAPETP